MNLRLCLTFTTSVCFQQQTPSLLSSHIKLTQTSLQHDIRRMSVLCMWVEKRGIKMCKHDRTCFAQSKLRVQNVCFIKFMTQQYAQTWRKRK